MGIKLVIISQQVLFRRGIESIMSAERDVEVVSSSDYNLDFDSIETDPADVVLIDLDGDADRGLALGLRLRQQFTNIAVGFITSNPNDEQLFEALRVQAAAYVGKTISSEDLANMIRRLADKDYPINSELMKRPKVAEQVLHKFQDLLWDSETESIISPLTRRETEILQHMAEGALNKEIASDLGISEQTIKNHVTSILRKLDANARTEAVVIAIKRNLIRI